MEAHIESVVYSRRDVSYFLCTLENMRVSRVADKENIQFFGNIVRMQQCIFVKYCCISLRGMSGLKSYSAVRIHRYFWYLPTWDEWIEMHRLAI